MFLALRLGALYKSGVVEPLGLGKDRRRDSDIIVAGQHPSNIERRVGKRCEAMRQQYSHGNFNSQSESGEDIIEQTNFVFRQSDRPADEEIGDLPQDFSAPLGRAARDCVFELGDECKICRHSVT